MPSLVSLVDIAKHHVDAEASLRLYFSSINPVYVQRFAGYSLTEVVDELKVRIDEADMRSALITLARVEAALYRDYRYRARGKLSDSISIAFRKIHKQKGDRARLVEDVLGVWKTNVDPSDKPIISQFQGMLKYRNWLAHGRYWNAGTTHSFQDVYPVAESLISGLPLLE